MIGREVSWLQVKYSAGKRQQIRKRSNSKLKRVGKRMLSRKIITK